MRYCLLMFILAAAWVIGIGCEQTESLQKPKASAERKPSKESATDDDPLLLDEHVLLLEDGPDTEGSDMQGADNSRCFVCHINYMQEDIAVIHARADIGCAGCHGKSDEHIADESWASGGEGTPPDIMYPRLKINPFCMSCHPRNRIDTEQHKPIFAANTEKKYCTDCHGNHRLTNRKCKWK